MIEMVGMKENSDYKLQDFRVFFKKVNSISENPKELVDYVINFLVEITKIRGISFFEFLTSKRKNPYFVSAKFDNNVSEYYKDLLCNDYFAKMIKNDPKFQKFNNEICIFPVFGKNDLIGTFITLDYDYEGEGFDFEFINYLFSIISLIIENSYLHIRQKKLFDEIITVQLEVLNARTQGAQLHSKNVQLLSLNIAKKLKLSQSSIETLKIGGLIFDIGKIGISDAILNKSYPLSEGEMMAIRKHVEYGKQIVDNIEDMNNDIKDIIYYHHESWNGKGYPEGKKEDEIPLLARIICVCDTFCAMTENRSYRDAIIKNKVLDYLKEKSGILYDPNIVKALRDVLYD